MDYVFVYEVWNVSCHLANSSWGRSVDTPWDESGEEMVDISSLLMLLLKSFCFIQIWTLQYLINSQWEYDPG